MAYFDHRCTCRLHPVGRISGEPATASGKRTCARPGAPKEPSEGPALLQGLAICGICGGRMKIAYHRRGGRSVPDYICDGRTVNDPQPMCQWIPGRPVDEAVGELLLEIMTPMAIEITLAVQQELQARSNEVERIR